MSAQWKRVQIKEHHETWIFRIYLSFYSLHQFVGFSRQVCVKRSKETLVGYVDLTFCVRCVTNYSTLLCPCVQRFFPHAHICGAVSPTNVYFCGHHWQQVNRRFSRVHQLESSQFIPAPKFYRLSGGWNLRLFGDNLLGIMPSQLEALYSYIRSEFSIKNSGNDSSPHCNLLRED